MPTILLPIPHHPQQQNADCLAACAVMALTHLHVTIPYEKLLQILKVKPFGTAGQNLHYLATLGVQVAYREGSHHSIACTSNISLSGHLTWNA